MRDRIDAFIPVAGGLAIATVLLITIGAAAVIAGGSLTPSLSAIAASYGSDGSNALALSVYADQSAVISSGAQLVRACADNTYNGFTHARVRSVAFKWLTSIAAFAIGIAGLANLRNFVALFCALTYVALRGALYTIRVTCGAPRRVARAIQRNFRSFILVCIMYMATYVVGSADAALASSKIINICRTIQACQLESFEGEASCMMASHRKQVGLPLVMPPCLDANSTYDISISLGLYAAAAIAANACPSPTSEIAIQHPEPVTDNNPITTGAQHILDRRALRRAALSLTTSDELLEPRPRQACALFYNATDNAAVLSQAAAVLSLAGLAPPSAPFFLYIGSGHRRPADFGEQIANTSDAVVVHVDTCVGGYGHDLRLPAVRDAVIALAALANCLGVLISVPCDTWSAVRFNEEVNAPQPLRDCDNVLGIPLEDGSLPPTAAAANTVADIACDIGRACAAHGGHVIAKVP